MNFGASDPLQDYQISTFAGVDFSTLENKVHMSRSPDAVNMLMNHNGYLEKRTGYRRLYQGEGRINGIFDYTTNEGQTLHFMHAGTNLYHVDFSDNALRTVRLLMSDLQDKKSRHFVFGGSLYITGCGYIRIKCKDNILEYGHVKSAGTVEETVDIADGDALQYVPTDAAYRAQYFSYDTVVSTKAFDSAEKMQDSPFAIKTDASSVKIEAVYVQKEEEWMPWDLKFVEISADGKKVELLGNEIYGAGVGTRIFEAAFSFANVKVVYSEPPEVADPLVFIHRTAVPIKRWKSDHAGDNSEVRWEYAWYTSAAKVPESFLGKLPLDGDMIDAANFASGRRRIQFTIPECGDVLCGYVAYLAGEKDKTRINRITIDGKIVHSYTDVYTQQYAPGSGTYGFCHVSTYDHINIDDDGRFVEFKKIAWHTNYNTTTTHDTQVNNDIVSGAVIEIDFTVLRVDAEDNDAQDIEQISACNVYGIYGGNNDTRVFLAGNPKYKNRDYASALYDATYFPNNMYTDVGSEASAIVGYHKLYANQIVVKDDAAADASQYLRSLNMDDAGNVTYTLLQGSSTYGANCASSFKQVGGVPFYIGPGGVYTIAGTTVQNQNNTTLRSMQINKCLLAEDLANAVCCRVGDGYIVATGTRLWVCDTLNNMEWFLLEDFPEITCMLSKGEKLYFGTADGRVCLFNEREDKNAYYDNLNPDGSTEGAVAVRCHWCTPISSFDNWNMYKTVVNVYISCMPYNDSSVHVYYNSSDEMEEDIATEDIALFDFSEMNFGNFSFDTIRQPKPFATGVKAKNVYVFGIKLENVEAQPFGIVSVGYKYKYSKYVK